MAYVSARIVSHEDYNLKFGWEAFVGQVKKALEEGKVVEVRSSSFSDPGEDWNELLVDGVAIPGSRVLGY